jgi:hypothetical protein
MSVASTFLLTFALKHGGSLLREPGLKLQFALFSSVGYLSNSLCYL